MPPYPGLVGPSYTSQSLNADPERLVNLYVEAMESPGAKTRAALYPTPGLSTVTTLDESPGRGLFAQDGRMWAAIGQALYEVTSGLVTISRGALAFNTEPVVFASGGDVTHQLLIASGDKAYVFDLIANTLTVVLASGARFVGYCTGQFVALDGATSKFQWSALDDGTSWIGFEFRSTAADRWQALGALAKEIWLWGSETTDVYVPTGSVSQPFAPLEGVLIDRGIAAPFAFARVGMPQGSAWMWLSQTSEGSREVVLSAGYVPVRVSTHAVERILKTYATISDAVADGYQEDGHDFFVLSFPSARATWVYDVTASLQLGFPCWHERPFWNTALAREEASRALYHCAAFGSHFRLDRATGALYSQSTSVYTDAGGAAIRRVRRGPAIYDENRLLGFYNLVLDVDVGVGTTSGLGVDPSIVLRVSRDGGYTWGNEHWRSLGRKGKYRTRVVWNQLGRARKFVPELSFSDPVPLRIVGASIDVT